MNADYVELHCHSHFSLLDGASPPEALVSRAVELGMPALALTDHDAVYGMVRFSQAAQAAGIKPILGAELTLDDDSHLTLLVEDQKGWHHLNWLISQARAHAPKGEAALPVELLAGHTEGLIALSGCPQGAIPLALRRGDREGAVRIARQYREWFGEGNFWIELQHHLRPQDKTLVRGLAGLAEVVGLGVVATNNVHYTRRDGHRLQDVLVCIREHTTLADSSAVRRANSEYYLKDARRMGPLFADYPQALKNTLRIAERCSFELAYGLQDLPTFPTPDGLSAAAYLRSLCEAALPRRYPDASSDVRAQLDYELQVIEQGQLANYFLIVWDIVNFAKQNGIRCQGRGSAANSLVAYLLTITPIDPMKHHLVFERFLSEERLRPPDIDIDFDAAQREEVIQYIYQRYGHDHAAMACTFVTYRTRSAIRDVGKVLGFPPHLIDRAARAVHAYGIQQVAESPTLQDELGHIMEGPLWQQLFDLAGQLKGFPRHLGIHNGGMVITGPPLAEHIATEPATMPDRVVVQWDKYGIEDSGMVKIDILGLRMLSVLAEAVEIIAETTGEQIDLDALSFNDKAVFAMLQAGDTVGVFQVESRAQTQLQPRLKPESFEDLITSVSLIRPGPIQGNMVHPYLRRRAGVEPVTYLHPKLKPLLEESLGVVIYQEQVLQIVRELAGLSAGQGEALRRALGSDLPREVIEELRQVFVGGAMKQGISKEIADQVYNILKSFGGYAFPKSHAGAFSVIVYQSAWLKRYHPAAFFAGLLNNQPMGFWSSAVLVNDAKRHGVQVLPVNANHSQARSTVCDGKIRLGFMQVAGIGEAGARRIVEARNRLPFTSLLDFCRRTQLPQRLVENLIRVGAMDGWNIPRRKLLWELGRLSYQVWELELDFPRYPVELPALTREERLEADYQLLGLSTPDHPMALYRDWLRERGITDSRGLKAAGAGERLTVAGWVSVHQAPPTAKGFRFITLEDEFGLIDIIIRPDIYQKHRQVIRGARLLVAQGEVQRQSGVGNLMVRRVSQIA